jgi:hypoxanthine phosphoribosyltransferase
MDRIEKYYTANGKRFKLYINEEKIKETVDEIAKRLNNDYEGKKPLFVVVLRGAMFFAADLMRRVDFDCELTTISAKSYGSEMFSSGKVEIEDNKLNIEDRDVIIVEDIVDSGHTMDILLRDFADHGARSIEVCSFLSKTSQRVVFPRIKYIGIEIDPIFVIGYGLDYAEQARQLPEIYILDEKE